MGSDWRQTAFGALMDVPTRNGIHKGLVFQGRGVPVVKMGEVYHADVIRDQPRDLLDLTSQELNRLEIRAGDLLLCRTSLVAGGVGHCAIVGALSVRSTFASNLIRVRLNPKKADSRYWFYYFRSAIGNEQLLSLARGTSVTTITGPDIAALNVRVPELGEQRAIAQILGTLDDKIELNRRMNETLEAIARALFKSWFVDFDPVRAKSEGRDPGLPPHLADLFPDSFDDSELGQIPREWDVLPLSKVCERITDGSHSSPMSVDVGRPMASVKDMHHWGFELEGCRRISEPDYQKLVRDDCRPRARDVLIAKDGSYLKHIFVVERDLDLVILSSIAILRPNGQMDPHLLAFSLRSDGTMARMEQYVSGAVLQRIVLKDFRQFPLLVPPTNLQRAWARTVTPIVKRCWRNVDESAALAALRDTLLPRLISGELPVDRGPNGERRK